MTPGTDQDETGSILYGVTPGRGRRDRPERIKPQGEHGGPIFVPQYQLSEDDRKSLAHSFDHLLALGMKQRYGWKMYAFGQRADQYTSRVWREDEGIDRPRHFYCINQEGRPVDVFGVFADQDALFTWWRQYLHDDREILDTEIEITDFDGDLVMRSLPTDAEMDKIGKYLDRLGLDQLSDLKFGL